MGDMEEDEARNLYPDLFNVLEQRVKPQRMKDNREAYRRYWWRFAERQPSMLRAIAGKDHILAILFTSANFGVARLRTGQVFSNSLNVFAYDDLATLSVLQARVHGL